MTDEKIKRINALSRKSRTPQGLTDQEREEQAALRREYIDSVKASLRAQLDNTVIIDEYGHHKYLKKH